ncbi:MAG TPA: hypothetical protein VND64_09620, partial [Pirellulales bacterium]|nr:hypothetical protein [Pirellulales bacterium]
CQILEVPLDELLPIIDSFRRPGVTFLMPSQDVELTDRTIIDISHESLMRVWTRLRHWVEEEAQAAGIYLRLSESAALYGERKAGLYRDPELGIALAWRESQHPNAAWAERYHPGFDAAMAFLAASREASLAEEQAREAARRRELAQVQQLAEAQQFRLEQQQRAARKLRKMLAGLALVALIAGAACIVALFANDRANRLAEVAETQRDNAEHNAAEAKREREMAETAETAAQRAEKRSREFRYATDMQLAARLIDDAHANARQVLDRLADHDPAKDPGHTGDGDLRGFEWHYLKRLVDSRATIFPSGEQPVTDSALRADGELVTLDEDGRLERWDVTTRRETRPALELRNGRSLSATALSPDGRRVALASAKEKLVHLVDAATGEDVVPALSAQARFGIIISPDNQMLVTLDLKIGWWDATTGKSIATQDSRLFEAGPLSISADGLTLAVSGPGWCSVFRMDPKIREISVLLDKDRLDSNMGSTRTAAISPDGRSLVVSQFHTGTVALFDISSGHSVKARTFDHAASVSAIGFDPQGTAMATACLDGSIKIWPDYRVQSANGTTSAETTALMGHRDEITRISFAAGGKQVISSSRDMTTRLWDLAQKAASVHRTLDGVVSRRMRFSPDGLLIAAAELEQGSIRLRDAETGQAVRELPVTVDQGVIPDSVAFSPDNRLLAVGYGGMPNVSYIELWEIDRSERLAVLPGTTDIPGFNTTAGNGIVSALCFSPDGKYLAAGFGAIKDLTVGKMGQFPLKVYDVATRRAIRILPGHENHCTAVTFSRDGSRMASGSNDGTARIWDTATWKTLHVLHNPFRGDLIQKIFHDVAFSPNAELLALASHDGTVQIWSAATGELRETLRGHANGVTSVAFSPDGRTLASGSYESSVRLWNVATWREVMRLDPEVGLERHSLAFSPDGRQLLATGSPAILWSTRLEDEIQTEQDAEQLAALLDSKADFTSRFRMLSENLRWHDALEVLVRRRPDDVHVQGALAAARANRYASRHEWKQAVATFDLLKTIPPHEPAVWFGMPDLLRLSTALLNENRPGEAALLVQEGVGRRKEEGGRMKNEQSVHPSSFILHPSNGATGEELSALLATIEERLADSPGDATLIELRAELAGQEPDYSAAIKILEERPAEIVSAPLRRLYRLRGDTHVGFERWPEALADYAHVVTGETTDEELLTNQARAQVNAMKPPERFVQLGRQIETNGMELVDYALDGATEPAEFEGQECRLVQTGSRGWGHAYFAIEDGFKWAPAMNVQVEIEYAADGSGNLVIQYDSHDDSYKPCQESVQFQGSKGWKTARFAIKEARFGNSQNARADFRFLVSPTGRFYIKRVSVRRLLPGGESDDPWVQLAGVHRMRDELEWLDKLVERHPASTAGIGDSFAADQEWPRAIEMYSRAITEQTTVVELLSKRARANEALAIWDAAAADWTRAAAGSPDGPRLLAEFGRRLADAGQAELAAAPRDRAKQLLETALRQDPENSLVMAELAQLLFGTYETAWTALKPLDMKSEGGATLALQPDGSILVSGTNPDNDVYVIEAEFQERIGAIRLEAIPDPSMPVGGSGRAPSWGNFVLTDFRVAAGESVVTWSRADADFSQEVRLGQISRFPIDFAIDGDESTGWAIWPRVTERHWAVFTPTQPINEAGDGRLTIRLAFHHKEMLKYGMGRFRLSVSDKLTTFENEQKLRAIMKIADPRMLLAAAYAQQGNTAEAAHWAGKALDDVGTIEAKTSLLEPLMDFDHVLNELRKPRQDDLALQLAETRSLARRGIESVDQRYDDQALLELKLARKQFTELVEKYPEPHWTVLKPIEIKSQGGATLTPLEDGSILAGGENQYPEVYTLVARPALERISAIRLEALPDPSFPQNGPGRCTCGNFWLNELRLFSKGKPFPLQEIIVADDEAQEFRKVIDGRIDKIAGWGKYRKAGEKHTAVVATRITRAANDDLKIEFHFARGLASLHNLGRFRVSVTADPDALEAERRRMPLQLKESEVVALDVALAKVLALQGDTNEAVAAFAETLGLARDRPSKAKIIAEAAPLADVLEQLAQRAVGDGQLQAELARHFADQGKTALANEARTKARTLFEEKLAREPENSLAATDLAQLLLENDKHENSVHWTVLKPVEARSELGATLSVLPDDSILAGGANPPNDLYRVVLTLGADIDLWAVRMEALTHPSLPGNGPGRYPGRDPGPAYRGTFARSSWKVTATLPNRNDPIPLEFDQARADHQLNQEIKSNGAWNIAGGEGRDSTAIWSVPVPISLAAGTALTFEMQFGGVGAENLGHFRLSVSGDPATIDRERQRLAATQLSDPWLKLAAAFAADGRNDEASRYFTRAFQQADGYGAKKPIVELASGFDDILSALAQGQPDDLQLQFALARKLAERGHQHLARKQPAEALAELQKSREMYTRLRAEPLWTVLKPVELKSNGGETLAAENDGSIFVSGPTPDRVVYTLKFQTELPALTAFRLETIPDARLPDGGAGRFGNGNFHLSEFTAAIESGQADARPTPIVISSAIADYEQNGIDTAKNSVDGNPGTHWDTYPRMREAHWAVFGLKSPARTEGGTLSITLDSGISPYPRHGLGRFRISATSEAEAINLAPLYQNLKDSDVVELHVALAQAHAQLGQTNEASASLTEALDLASDRAGKAKIVAAAAPLDGVLDKLVERAAASAPFQAELARHFAEQGNTPRAEAARAKARALFEQQLAKEPDDSLLARELADVLLPRGDHWTVLKPIEMNTENGVTLELQNDGSVFAPQQKPPKNDTYTLVLRSELTGIRGLRLEVLPDQRLPNGGSGWAGSGNFVLNELTLHVAPAESPGEARAIAVRNASADFSQRDWHVRGLVDGNNGSGWAVEPDVKRDHTAVFELTEAVGDGHPSWLTVRLVHLYGDPNYNLGRFRLSVTADSATLDRDQKRFAANQITEPWAKLAAAYRLIGDQPAMARLLERHPAAAAGSGDLYAADQDWERAIAEYGKALTPASTEAEVFAKRAEAFEKLQQWEPAIADWGRVDELVADKNKRYGDYSSLIRRARLYERVGQYEKALADYDRAVGIPNAGLDPLLWRVAYRCQRGQWKGAAADYRQVWSRRDPSWYAEWYYSRERSLINLLAGDTGGYRQAAAELLTRTEKILDGDSSRWLVYVLLAGPDAITDVNRDRLTAAAERIDPWWNPRLKGALMFRRGEFQQAADLFDQNGGGTAFEFLAAMAHHQLQHFDRARQLFEQGNTWLQQQRDSDPGCGGGVPRNHYWGEWAIVLQLQREAAHMLYAQQLTELDARLQAEPDSAAILLDRARMLSKIGLHDEALADLSKVVVPPTDTSDFFGLRGRVLADLNRTNEALADLDRAIELESSDALVYAARAKILWNRGAVERARRDFEKSLGIEPLQQTASLLADMLLEADGSEWTVLAPSEMKSEAGARLSLQADGSILVSGMNPDRDDYTLVAHPDIHEIVAIRLEALPDPSLPGNGPGRSDSGNFHLNELRLFSGGKPCSMTGISVVFDQGQQSQNVIDGKIDESIGWGNYPRMGKPNTAIVTTRLQRGPDEDLKLDLFMSRGEWKGHNLGRFRLSVTGESATLDWEQKRIAAMKLTNPWAKLAAAYAVHGHNEEALPYFSRALQQAESYEARKPILEIAARFDNILSGLVQGQPDDLQLQLALARNLTARGQTALAAEKPAEALALLKQAQDIFTRLLAPVADWTVLTPVEMRTDSGAKLELQNDRSVFVPQPSKNDDYLLVFETNSQGIKGLRLEVLTDSRLPNGGPGWAAGAGNFVLNELTLHAAPANAPDQLRSIALRNASADFSQQGWDVRGVLDGTGSTGWAIWPEVNKDHTALVDLAEEIGDEQDSRLTVRLRHQHSDPNYLLGRFRVSFTNDAAMLQATRIRLDLKDNEVADLNVALADAHVALAKAHAQQDHTGEAIASFTEALKFATDRGGKASIIAAAAPLDGVLEELTRRTAGDASFQAELARFFGEQGNTPLADAARAKARALFERQLGAEPDNAAAASELAGLLWSTLTPVEQSWIDDAAPVAANLFGDTPWEFVSQPDHPVFSGQKAMRRRAAGQSQHYFDGATPGLKIGEGARLFAYVYLDPQDPPKTVMLQFKDGSWDHRAFWGDDLITYGTGGTENHLSMGSLPKFGEWVRLEVEAKRVGLRAGAVLNGWAFTQYAGTCYWDAAGCTNSFASPWQQLAAAYHLLGDQPALDKLLERHPEATAGIGDLYASKQDWERAIAEYTRAIDAKTQDARIFA